MRHLRHILNLLSPHVVAGSMCACGATNTGNPGPVDDGLGAPEGIAQVRSALERAVTPEVSAAELEQFGESSRDFAFDLYGQAALAEGNVFVSPYSVQVALGMLYAGARGQTRIETASALHFELPEPALHAAFNATDRALQGRKDELAGNEYLQEPGAVPSTGDILLRVVNAAFGRRGTEFQPSYLDVLAQHYGTGMFAADFVNAPERERVAINDWVAGNTNDRILDLLPLGSIDPSVVFVLVNTIYFKGSWLDPFDAANTRPETFHAPGGDASVQMMNGFAETYAEGDGYQALELPYIAPALRMLFILPAEGRFAEIESGLNREVVDSMRGELSRWSVTLKVPKFSFQSSFELSAAMQALGMQQAFQMGAADLSGIAGAPGDIFVSEIFHQTFVAVDEEGTEASAATAVIGRDVSAPPPADFFLDRPFLFLIYDEPTGQILFVGRVQDPG